MAQVLAGEPLTIHGQGDQTRDFLYVRDAVEALLIAAGLSDSGQLSGVYNVGTGLATSIRELAELLWRLEGREPKLVIRPGRPGDIKDSLANTGKYFAVTGHKCRTSLEQGLKLTLDWFKKGTSELI